jgi:hypothetical protein
MSGSDLIVLAPWAIFAAGLALVLIRLRRSRRTGRRRPSLDQPPRQPKSGVPRRISRLARRAAERDQQKAGP